MKLMVSLSGAQLAFLDHSQSQHNFRSRGEEVQAALRLLQDRMLEEEYRVAGEEWKASEDAALWDGLQLEEPV